MARPAQWERLCLEPSADDRKAGNPINGSKEPVSIEPEQRLSPHVLV